MSKARTDTVKTDNANLPMKARLRADNLPRGLKVVRVLDAYHGTGAVWREVARRKPGVRFDVVGIDKKAKSTDGFLGDNMKWLPALPLDQFDVIDLDAYGCPFAQLELLFARKFNGMVFVTFNQTVFGCLPNALLQALGFTKAMVRKCPTMFYANGQAKLFGWLANNEVRKVHGFFRQNGVNSRAYFVFTTP